MKTYLIPIENHDDYISINDKIVWAKSPRVLLVWPDKGRVRLYLSDLILILRQAERVGSQVAIVSDDPAIRDLCSQVNLSVFSSIPAAQKRAWRRPKKTRRFMARSLKAPTRETLASLKEIQQKNAWKLPTGIRIIVFFSGIFAVLALAGVFIPAAEITLTPKTIPQTVTISVWSNPNVQSVNLSGAVPIKTVPIVTEGSLIKRSSGVERIPTQFATGTVIFRNLTNQRLEIPTGTVVRTITADVVCFKTTKTIVLDAGIDVERTVPVIALNPGVAGNVKADEIQAVEGDIGGNVVVNNPAGISGGVDTKTTAPSVADYENARQELLHQLKIKVTEEFSQQGDSDVFLRLDELIHLDEILVEKHNPEIGMPADQFQLTLEVRYLVSYLSIKDVQNLAAQTLQTNLAPGYQLLSGTFRVLPQGTPEIVPESREVRVKVRASQDAMRTISETDILALVVGKSVTVARSNLASRFEEVQLSIQPSFVNRLPWLAFRIKVVIDGLEL